MTTPALVHPLMAELFAPKPLSWRETDPLGRSHNLRYSTAKLTDHPAAAEVMDKFSSLPPMCSRSIYGNVFVYSKGHWRKES